MRRAVLMGTYIPVSSGIPKRLPITATYPSPSQSAHSYCTSTILILESAPFSAHSFPPFPALLLFPPPMPRMELLEYGTVEGFWIGMRCQMGDVSLLLPARSVMFFQFVFFFSFTCLGGFAMVNRNFPIGYIIVV